VTKAREMLWRWSVVVDQLTAAEAEIWKDDLQLLIHNVAYHPEFNPVEKLWRYCKALLQAERLDDIRAVRRPLPRVTRLFSNESARLS
jgi:hypothetical protein